MFCPTCGGSEFERIEEEEKSSTPAPSDNSGRTCPRCKARNEAYAVLCVCGESLESEGSGAPQAVQAKESRAQLQARKALSRLLLIVGSQVLECHHGDVFGRDGTLACDLFRPIPTVSGRHVGVELRNDRWFLVNLPLQPGRSDKNITEVDGVLLTPGASIALSGEHVVRMSSRCEVRLRVEILTG